MFTYSLGNGGVQNANARREAGRWKRGEKPLPNNVRFCEHNMVELNSDLSDVDELKRSMHV